MSDHMVTVSDILTKNKLFLSFPGAVSLSNDLYASVDNAKLNLAKRRRYTSRIKSSASSLSIGSQTQFSLDPGTIIGNCYIVGKFTLGTGVWAYAQPGWGYRLIKNLIFNCAGSSSIAQITVSGESLMDMVMISCNSQDKREELLNLGGELIKQRGVETSYYFAIPLYMFFTSAEQNSVFPFDAATIRSQISFSLEWNSLNTVISNVYDTVAADVKAGFTLPTSFDELYLKVHNTIELESQYVSNAMAANPFLAYNMPVLHYQYYKTTVTSTQITDELNVNLNSIPMGMLQGIVFSARPKSWYPSSTAITADKFLYNGLPVPFEYVKVLYMGQVIYESNNIVEENLIQCMMDDGSSAVVKSKIAATMNDTQEDAADTLISGFHIIPFSNEMSNVLRHKQHEFTPSYGGSVLQVIFKFSQKGVPIIDFTTGYPDYIPLPNADTYDLNFTYIVNGLLEINQGSMSLQLE